MKNLAHFWRKRDARLLSLLWFLVPFVLTALVGTLLFRHEVIDGLISTLINIGLDPLRAQLVASLLLTAAAALIGTAFVRRRAGAFVGAALVFCFAFLFGFVQTQLQPVTDPGGHPEPLNTFNLLRNSVTMLGLGLLSAFIGAAVGSALYETVLEPPYRLLCSLWQRQRARQERHESNESRPSLTVPLPRRTRAIGSWLAASGMVVLLVLAANSGDLFLFSPDTGIHSMQLLKNQANAGQIVADNLVSPALNNQRRAFLIYLPASYAKPENKAKHYPVVYLLHGSPGRPVDWLTGGKADESADTLIATKKISDLLIVVPDGNGRPGATSEWGNSYDQRQLMENYVASDLVKYVDKHYRTIPDATHRAIGGLSMGGFGAMNIAVHHPEVFGNVISLGGYYRAEGSIWGKNKTYQQLNSPQESIRYSQQAWQLQMFLGAATSDKPFYQYTVDFMKTLDELHIHYQFDLENGFHSWRVWQKQFYNALQWLKWKAPK